MTDWEQQCLNRFQHLALYFVNSYNPEPHNKPAVIDCILSFPYKLIPATPAGRYFANDFPRAICVALEGGDVAAWMKDYPAVAEWLVNWAKEEAPVSPKQEDDGSGYQPRKSPKNVYYDRERGFYGK